MTFRKSYKTHRMCASPIPPFRESLPALLSFLPDETQLGLHRVAAQSCRIMCGQVRSAKVGLAQSPEVHGHADGWSGSLWLLHSWSLAEQESKWERTLDVSQMCFSYGSVQSVPPPPRELGRRRAVDLEDEGTSPEITWISASLSLMMLQMSVHLGSGMKQIQNAGKKKNTLTNYAGSSLLFCTPFRQHHPHKTPLKHFTAILHSTSHCFTHLPRCK